MFTLIRISDKARSKLVQMAPDGYYNETGDMKGDGFWVIRVLESDYDRLQNVVDSYNGVNSISDAVIYTSDEVLKSFARNISIVNKNIK